MNDAESREQESAEPTAESEAPEMPTPAATEMRPRTRPRSDAVTWVLFALAATSATLACVIPVLPGDGAALRDALEHAGASPGLLLSIAAIALVGGLCLRRVNQVEGVFRDVGDSHEALLDRNEALQRSLDEVKRLTDLARVERFSSQLEKLRGELTTLRSELETRVLPAPELRRSFEDQGNKFADLGKFLHRLRTEWLEGMRNALQPLARQADLAPLQTEIRAIAQRTSDVPKSSQLEAATEETRAALREIGTRVDTLEESLGKTESHFGSIESYLGSVSERIEGSFRDMRSGLDDDRKRRPVDFREEWSRVQATLREEWSKSIDDVREDVAHRKEEIRHEIRTAIADSEKELRSVLASIEWLRNRLEALPDSAAPLGTLRESLDSQNATLAELRQTFAASQHTLEELSTRVGELPGHLKDDLVRAGADVEREFGEVRRKLEARLATLEEFRGNITGLTEESRRIREAIHEVETSLLALRTGAEPVFAAAPSPRPPTADPEPAASPAPALVAAAPAAAPRAPSAEDAPATNDSVFSAIEKLRSMMGGS
jgi:prefoldin subunit 5